MRAVSSAGMRNTPRPSAGISAPSRPGVWWGSFGLLQRVSQWPHILRAWIIEKTPINSQCLCPGVTNVLNSDALRLFLAVVDAGTMSAAAEMLGQTASGVSRLSRLEKTWA